MEIIVETGAGVVDANSYNSLEEVISFAEARGLTLPCNEDGLKPLVFKTMDYFKLFSARYVGSRVLETQSLDWPREYAEVNCRTVGTDEIPWELKEAHIHLMVAYYAGHDPLEIVKVEPFVTEKMLGPMKVKYAKPGDFDAPAYEAVRVPIVDSLMSGLLDDGGAKISFVKA